MKRVLYAFAILLCVVLTEKIYDVVIPEKTVKASVNAENNVEKILLNNQINTTESEVDAFFYYGPMYLSDESCRELADGIAGQLGITTEYEYVRNYNENGSVAVLHKAGNRSDVQILINTVEEQENENMISQKQYIQIKVKIDNSISSGIYFKQKVSDIIGKLSAENRENINPDDITKNAVTMSIRGSKKGTMNIVDEKNLGEALLKGVGADKVFENVGDHSYSVYGYSDTIEEYVAIGKNKMNVNIVYSYDEDNDITTIHLASPIVNYDY